MSDLDPRLFTYPPHFLNAWCRVHPERSVADCTEELARHAGCSEGLMAQILNEERALQPHHAEGLARGLGLDGSEARHLRAITALQRATPDEVPELLRVIREAQAEALGVPWEAAEGLVQDAVPAAAVVAALGPALAALGPERHGIRALAPRATIPVSADQIGEATPQRHQPVAPRLVVLDAPRDPLTSSVWHGLLGWADEAINRVNRGRQHWTFIAAMDEPAERRLTEIDRSLHTRLVELARRHAQDPAGAVLTVLFERQRLVSPPQAPAPQSGLYWQRPRDLLLSKMDMDSSDAAMSASTHRPRPPTGEVQPLGFLDLPTCVRAWRNSRKARGKPCSDGYIARRTGLPKASVQDIIHGRVRFGPRHVEPFARIFERGDEAPQVAALNAMAELNRMRWDPSWVGRLALAQRRDAAAQGVVPPETEAWFVASRWYTQAIHMMASLGGFEPCPGWISRTLGGRITWEAAEQGLRALAALGLLQEGPDGRVFAVDVVQEQIGLPGDLVAAQRDRSVLRLLKAELALMDEHLGLYGAVLALPEDAVPEVKDLLSAVLAETEAILAEAEARRQAGGVLDRVVLVSAQRFTLFQRLGPRPRA